MTEKEIKKYIVDVELTSSEKESFENHITSLEELLLKEVSPFFTFQELRRIGSYPLSIIIHDEKRIELALLYHVTSSLEKDIKQKLLMNFIENTIYLNDSHLKSLERIQSSYFLLTYDDQIQFKLKVCFDESLLTIDLKRKEYLENENRTYSYFKNVLKFIKAQVNELKLQKLDDYTLSILLSYGLHRMVAIKSYEQYLQAFLSSLDDLLSEKKMMMDPLSTLFSNQKYVVVDPVDENINLTAHLDEVSLTEVRNLKKKLQKLFESVQEEILGGAQLVLDVTPVYVLEKDCYLWSYKIVGTQYSSQGGEFKHNPIEYKTAILRALFKGLKFIVDSQHIYTKTILIQGTEDSILKCVEKNIDEQENNSRRKTIMKFIDENKLKLNFKSSSK